MGFAIAIVLALIAAIFIVVSTLRSTGIDPRKFEDSKNEAVELRKLSSYSWEEFYQFFLKKGYSQNVIEVVKNSIQQFSIIAQVMIFPCDDIYRDLKIDAMSGEDDDLMYTITEKLNLLPYSEGELIDNDVITVSALFDFIHTQKKNANE